MDGQPKHAEGRPRRFLEEYFEGDERVRASLSDAAGKITYYFVDRDFQLPKEPKDLDQFKALYPEVEVVFPNKWDDYRVIRKVEGDYVIKEGENMQAGPKDRIVSVEQYLRK